ncbi:MAG: hypothetical protein N3I35_11465 [Clostridia bacterium]|nr:hypothetical protein [Clostridia bacterium]
MDRPDKNHIQSIIETIQELNDVYFEVVKKIYNANFLDAKKTFLGTDSLLERVIVFSGVFDRDIFESKAFDLDRVNELMMKVIDSFEHNNPQAVVDLLLFDFSSALNEYADQLEKVNS